MVPPLSPRLLEAEGLVTPVRRRGTVVRQRPPMKRLGIERYAKSKFHPALWAVGVTAAIGLLVVGLKVDIESAKSAVGSSMKLAGISFKVASIGTEAFIVANFIWAFRFNRTPPAITQAFVKDLGGTPSAIAASHYLSGQLGLGALILLFGLLLGLAGISPRVGCTALVLFILTFIGLYIYASTIM